MFPVVDFIPGLILSPGWFHPRVDFIPELILSELISAPVPYIPLSPSYAYDALISYADAWVKEWEEQSDQLTDTYDTLQQLTLT